MCFETIKRNNDFVRAYKRGKCAVDPMVVLYYQKNRYGKTRIGITASKKVGNAVQRNRAKRVITHALSEALPADAGGYDLVLVARARTVQVKSTQLAPRLAKLLRTAGILK